MKDAAPEGPVGAEGGAAGVDLYLAVASSGGRRAQVMSALREAIRSGRLAPGTRLPPYRSLAADLGIARNTVAAAYAELVEEGWLTARQGSGTRVAQRAAAMPVERGAPMQVERTAAMSVERSTPMPVERTAAMHADRSTPKPVERGPFSARRGSGRVLHDLQPSSPNAAAFPRADWVASTRRAMAAAPNEAFGVGDPRGRPELRGAVAEYLSRARGVRADPGRIVITTGFAHGLHLLADALDGPIAMEAYSLPYHRELLRDKGVRTVSIGVDTHGAVVEELRDSPARAVLLTPAHQYPTGGPLHPERRVAVVDWIRSTGAFLLEDDYDGEFRYDREPVGALQGLDPDRIVYLGSVSKSLSPALRVGWMVLPDTLIDRVLAVKEDREMWVSVIAELTLADFLCRGAYDRHLRRTRTTYRRRRALLVETLARRAPHIRITGIAAGLHAVLELPTGTEESTLRAARRLGLALDGLHRYRHPDATVPARDGLVIGYGTPADHAFGPALEALCLALPQPDR
ncbi:MocR-like pyridoxine biosynthesis transcription factor PdxR [Nocardia sp. CDC160]|uniref:MocR-like pyridoxine biosynthesis transcription factor PdxR n=1 Tax=Nocardia sp. CDC160 TaxID=3112166 RepID=UPI002DBCD740|nr:PLP-dependent aminotransferase family protein [Nocardia sp. CDC160]MEC3918894.1 PLP-dependent aminotransferase family protein [Nocardia sp. CDC160]